MASQVKSPLHDKDRIIISMQDHSTTSPSPTTSTTTATTTTTTTNTTSSSSPTCSSTSASPLILPELLPSSSSSDRSSFSTKHSSTSSSRNSSNPLPLIQSTTDYPYPPSNGPLSSSNAQAMERLVAAEQEKQSHYLSRRSPLGPRPEGSLSFEQTEEEEKERLERLQAQAEGEMYAHMHAHIRTQADKSKSKSKNKSSSGNGRAQEEGPNQPSGRYENGIRNGSMGTSRSGREEGMNGDGDVAVVASRISQDPQESSHRDYRQEAQLQAAAKYASLASLSPPSMIKDSRTRQEVGEGNHLSPTDSSSINTQEELPRLSTSSAESSGASDVTTPEKYESGIWTKSELTEKDRSIEGSKLQEALERKAAERYLDPEPDTQDLRNLQTMMNQSSISRQDPALAEESSIPEGSSLAAGFKSRPPLTTRQRSSDKSSSAYSSHTAVPSRSSSIRASSLNPKSQSTLLTSPPSPPSTVSATSSAAQTPAASQDRDPIAELMRSNSGEGLDQKRLSTHASLDMTKPIGMSGSSSTQRKSPPPAPTSQQESSSFLSSSSMPYSNSTASTASGPGGAPPTSPTTSAGLSLRTSLASPDSWRSLLPEHDPYFADPDAEDGSRSTAGSVAGSGSASGHGDQNAEERFRKNSRQNSYNGMSAAGSSALGIASMNTPSATSLSAQLAQFGVGSYGAGGGGVGEPFPRCSSRASGAGSSTGVPSPVNQNSTGTAYAYAYGTSSSAAQEHMRRLSSTSQLSSFSLPGPTHSHGLNPSFSSSTSSSGQGQDENWEEREKERMKRESWRSFLPEGDPAHPTSTNASKRGDLYAPHRRTNTNSAASVASSPSLSFSDSANQNQTSPAPPNWQQSPSQQHPQLSPRLNRATGLYEDLSSSSSFSSSGRPNGQVPGNSSSPLSAEAARRHASFSTWESAQRDRDGFRGSVRGNGSEKGIQPPSSTSSTMPRNPSGAMDSSRRTGSVTSNTYPSPFGGSFNNVPSEGMSHSHSHPPHVPTTNNYPNNTSSSTSTSHSTTQFTSYRNLHQQLQSSNHNPNSISSTQQSQTSVNLNSNKRLPTSAVMGDNEEREFWPTSGTSLSSSSSLGGDQRGVDMSFSEDGDQRRASGLRGDLEGWTTAREGDMGSTSLTRTYDAPVSIVQEHLDSNNSVLLTTTTTTTTTTFTRVSQPSPQPQSPISERSNPSSPTPSMPVRSFSNSGSNLALSSPIAVPNAGASIGRGGVENESPYLVSPLSPPSVPFLDHRQAPLSTNLTIETTPARYILNLRLPNFSLEHITLATKHHRTLQIIADDFSSGGGHVERRVTFQSDAIMRAVQAEFDGETLKVIVPRRITTNSSNGKSILNPVVQLGQGSINHYQQQQQQQQQSQQQQQQLQQ